MRLYYTLPRHPRVGGDPDKNMDLLFSFIDSRLRGNDRYKKRPGQTNVFFRTIVCQAMRGF